MFVFQEQNMGLYLSLKNPINALITIQYIILISLKLQRKREIFSDLSNKQLFFIRYKIMHLIFLLIINASDDLSLTT